MWILTVMLLMGVHSGYQSSIAVAEYTSEKRCLAAGELLKYNLTQGEWIGKSIGSRKFYYTCTEK